MAPRCKEGFAIGGARLENDTRPKGRRLPQVWRVPRADEILEESGLRKVPTLFALLTMPASQT